MFGHLSPYLDITSGAYKEYMQFNLDNKTRQKSYHIGEAFGYETRPLSPEQFDLVKENRAEEISSIEQAFKEKKGVLFFAPSGAGKTSLGSYLTSETYLKQNGLQDRHGVMISVGDLSKIILDKRISFGDIIGQVPEDHTLRLVVDGILTDDSDNMLNGGSLDLIPRLMKYLDSIPTYEVMLTGLPIPERHTNEFMDQISNFQKWHVIEKSASFPIEKRPKPERS